MDVARLIARRNSLIEQLERQQYEFWPANIVQILELERIMETLDRLTMESPNIEGFCDVNGHGASGWGTENTRSE